MTTKSPQDWTEHLSESALPNDAFTFTKGINYGIDGYTFDEPYGEGLVHMPENRGITVPDGFVGVQAESPGFDELTESDDGLSFSEGVMGDKEASIVHLEWLDPTQNQDPSRLPHMNESLEQLEDIWGQGSTDGLHLIPNILDLDDAQYEEALHQTTETEITSEEVRDALYRATRRAHFGHSLAQIKSELEQTLGVEAASAPYARIASEYGLLGNVYVIASVFPGLKNGTWAKEIRRSCKTARFVVTDDEMIARKLSMRRVAELADILWSEAMDLYRPMLQGAGYKLASGDPKVSLRKAFLKGATQAPIESFKEVIKPAISPLSVEEARQRLAKEAPKGASFKTPQEVAVETELKKARVQLARWVKAGQITQKDAVRLAASTASPREILKAATTLITTLGKTAQYKGDGTREKDLVRMQVFASLTEQEKAVEASRLQEVKASLLRAVKGGLLTTGEASRIVQLGKTASETQHIIGLAIHSASAQRKAHLPVSAKRSEEYKGTIQKSAPAEVTLFARETQKVLAAQEQEKLKALRAAAALPKAVPTKDYAGFVHTAVPVAGPTPVASLSKEEQGIRIVAKAASVKVSVVQDLVQWVRETLNEGAVGDSFNRQIKARFSPSLLKAATTLVSDLRKAHEGLAGHLYIDASAYATEQGVAGCAKGALKHRASSVKYVLAMDRCATCTLNTSGTCQKYNKTLASSPPVKDRISYQEKILRKASSAPGYVSEYDPSEYGLQNDAVDNLSFEPDTTTDLLSNISFSDDSFDL